MFYTSLWMTEVRNLLKAVFQFTILEDPGQKLNLGGLTYNERFQSLRLLSRRSYVPTRLSNFPLGYPKTYFSHRQVISVSVLLSKPNLAIQINPH